MAYITDEHSSRNYGRFKRVERSVASIRSAEITDVGYSTFTGRDDGTWIAVELPSRTKAIRSGEAPVNPITVRKPDAEEVLCVPLGESLYKGQITSVYEEVTWHVLVRTFDQSEIHYENRTRFWMAVDQIVRRDTYYAIFDGSKTTRIFSSTDREADPNLMAFDSPVKITLA